MLKNSVPRKIWWWDAFDMHQTSALKWVSLSFSRENIFHPVSWENQSFAHNECKMDDSEKLKKKKKNMTSFVIIERKTSLTRKEIPSYLFLVLEGQSSLQRISRKKKDLWKMSCVGIHFSFSRKKSKISGNGNEYVIKKFLTNFNYFVNDAQDNRFFLFRNSTSYLHFKSALCCSFLSQQIP